jgi:hypothetical protein
MIWASMQIQTLSKFTDHNLLSKLQRRKLRLVFSFVSNSIRLSILRCSQSKAASAPSGSNAPRQPRAQNQQADAIVKTVSVPASLHTRIAQGGKFFRTLPNGIRIDHGDVKPPSSSNRAGGSQPNGAGKAARIDEEEDESDFHWEVTPLSDEQDNGEEIPWNIKGNDQAKVDRVEGMIQAALERSKAETHRGVLTVPQTLIPRSTCSTFNTCASD